MKFLFKYPTRGRPDWFRETLSAYCSKLSGQHEFQFVIAMDNDDEQMNNPAMRDWLNVQNHLSYFYSDHANKIQACNTGIPDDGWDVLVLISDDMTPVVQGFDDIIARDMQREFPELDGAMHYWDGRCPGTKDLITQSIMGRKLYDRIGFVYWPAYKGVWCDNDFTDLAKQWGKYFYSDNTIVRHAWREKGSDEVYEKGESTAEEDKRVYDWRKERGFPVSFSQGDEDWIIRKYFRDQFKGRFLDIGAADGVTFSNTKILYDMGWQGVVVEPSPALCLSLIENCKRVKLVQAALTVEDGPVEFYDSQGDFVSTTNEAHKNKWSQVPYQKIGVDGISWQTLLAKHGCDFDFINLDIEGENIPILQLMPEAYKRRARMFCIEHDGRIDVVKAELEPYGFRVIHTNGENVVMGI